RKGDTKSGVCACFRGQRRLCSLLLLESPSLLPPEICGFLEAQSQKPLANTSCKSPWHQHKSWVYLHEGRIVKRGSQKNYRHRHPFRKIMDSYIGLLQEK
ncbi:hypothetical protein KI387_032019, partial [Taxus chinensis]